MVVNFCQDSEKYLKSQASEFKDYLTARSTKVRGMEWGFASIAGRVVKEHLWQFHGCKWLMKKVIKEAGGDEKVESVRRFDVFLAAFLC